MTRAGTQADTWLGVEFRVQSAPSAEKRPRASDLQLVTGAAATRSGPTVSGPTAAALSSFLSTTSPVRSAPDCPEAELGPARHGRVSGSSVW
jgi:hypothetical protein